MLLVNVAADRVDRSPFGRRWPSSGTLPVAVEN
jgi:hypothetical protein